MKEEWKKVKLGEISADIQTGPFGSQLHMSDYSEKGIPVVMPKDMINGKITEENIARVTDNHVKRLNRYIISSGNILYARRGDVGKCVYVSEKESGWLCGTGCLRININTAIANPKFVFFQLQKTETIGWVEKNAVGATMLNLNTSILANVPLHLPPLPTQQKIASVLSAYDDLIENNRRQIKLLEEAALKLYKEWFVKLNFPGHENTKIVDGIPEGWKKERIDSFVELQNGFAFKSDSFDDEGIYRIITIKNVQDGAFDSNNVSRIKQIPSKMPEWCNLKLGDILLSLTGNVGRVCLVTSANCLLNQRVAKLKSDYPAYTYILFRSKDMFIMMNNLANGAAQQNLSPIRTGEQKILKPAETIIKKFEEITSPCIKKILMLFQQIEILQLARDKLLPKLMNGEIEV